MPIHASKLPVPELKTIARQIRARIIENSHKTQTPHLGSCLSCVDILVAAYFHVLRLDTSDARAATRDRFILSKGHGAPALFQILARRGFYPVDDLKTYGEDGGVFAEHPPTPEHLPGIEAATGSLGHGMPMGLGMALAGRIQGLDYNVFALVSDGECNEGSIWESAMMAAANKVERLCVIVDFNKWQATGRSEEIIGVDSLANKWRAFGWNAVEADGHDMETLVQLMSKVPDGSGKPLAIVAHTVKGRGASFMEDDNNWHYRIPTADEVLAAKKELGVEA
ncbi:MAG: transketolase [Burkholderiales bacterium]